MKSIKAWVKFGWKWSWVITLPIAVVFFMWCNSVQATYRDFGLRYTTMSNSARLLRVMEYEYATLARKGQLLFKGKRSIEEGEAPRVQLLLSNSDESKLNSNLPASGLQYVEGALLYPDGELLPVDLRYRGDFFWHWAMGKKSWRVKTSKTAMWNHMRKINLVAPKTPAMVTGDLGYWLARDMGLIAPRSEVVEVWVNGEPRGVHTQVEQLEELVLRQTGRMPGDLFAGELVGRDSYTNIPGRVFQYPGIWEKVALNNHFDPEARDAMVLLCELLQAEPSEEVYSKLRALLNYEAFGKFTAYRQLIQSGHYDNSHNWRLYYDPWRNRFEPVVWDPNAWHKSWLPATPELAFEVPFFCELDEVLRHDVQYRLANHEALVDFLVGGGEERLLRHFEEKCESITGAVQRDPDLAQFFKPLTIAEVGRGMQHLRAQIRGLCGEFRNRHVKNKPIVLIRTLEAGSGEYRARIGVGGYRPIQGLQFEFDGGLATRPDAFLAYINAEGERVEVDVSGSVVLDGALVSVRLPLLPGYRFEARESRVPVKQREYVPEVRTYDLRLVFAGQSQASPHVVRHEYGDGQLGNPMTVDALKEVAFKDSYAVVMPNPIRQHERWSGVVRVEGQRTIHGPVIMEPGTVLEMAVGASLIFEGRVIAVGTASDPITVQPALEGQDPWGVLALRGHGADHSRFEFCNMSGGSGWKLPLAEYSAMFSIHDVANVSVLDCEFRDSQVVDDMVHAVYADELLFRNCLFERSLFDSLDIDISNGRVIDCEFKDSGNDSLDLMTSTVLVLNTRVTGSADKAFSVGEGSHVLLKNCWVEDCVIGTQVKDGSSAYIVECEFIGNGIALDAYKKNWRYDDGGDVHVRRCWFERNDSSATVDKNSRMFIADSYYSEKPEPARTLVLDRRNRWGKAHASDREISKGRFRLLPAENNPVKPFMAEVGPLHVSKDMGVTGRPGRR
ncbi:MAG: hypothetical protein ACI9X4_001278 [Glaciecola sp.]|jgi:hypothetical protein